MTENANISYYIQKNNFSTTTINAPCLLLWRIVVMSFKLWKAGAVWHSLLVALIPTYHDDVIKLKHFPRYWPFVWGIHPSPVNSAHKGQWREALMFSLICAWINGWVNNREAGDLRRHHTHCDVTVMHVFSKLSHGQVITSHKICALLKKMAV